MMNEGAYVPLPSASLLDIIFMMYVDFFLFLFVALYRERSRSGQRDLSCCFVTSDYDAREQRARPPFSMVDY